MLHPLLKHPAYTDISLLFLRLMIGTLMAVHGIQKVISHSAIEHTSGLHANASLPSFAAYGTYLGELVVPILLILGIFSRLSAAVIIGNMLFVIVLTYQPELFALNNFGGYVFELKLIFLLGAGAIAALGSGRYAVIQD